MLSAVLWPTPAMAESGCARSMAAVRGRGAIAFRLAASGFGLVLVGRIPNKLAAVSGEIRAKHPKTEVRTFVLDFADEGLAAGWTRSRFRRNRVVTVKDSNDSEEEERKKKTNMHECAVS